jgi:hypothetical protein
MMKKTFLFFALLLCTSPMLAGTVSVYIDQPGSAGENCPAAITGCQVNTFNNIPTGAYTSLSTSNGLTFGTYTGSFVIVSGSQGSDTAWGGAGGSQYFVFGNESGSYSPVTLTLPGEEDYFGLWWSAGDQENGIAFYNNGQLVSTFTTATLLSILNSGAPGTTVTAINGSVYDTSSYFGNPYNSQDGGEPFAYLMFNTNGIQFNQVVFTNPCCTGFESDNHSIAAGNITIPGTAVFVQDIPADPPVPEGGSNLSMLALCGLGLAGALRFKAGQPA